MEIDRTASNHWSGGRTVVVVVIDVAVSSGLDSIPNNTPAKYGLK